MLKTVYPPFDLRPYIPMSLLSLSPPHTLLLIALNCFLVENQLISICPSAGMFEWLVKLLINQVPGKMFSYLVIACGKQPPHSEEMCPSDVREKKGIINLEALNVT